MWDGEVAAIRGGLRSTRGKKILILSGSQAALKAIRKAGKTGRARTRELLKVVELIRERKEELGEDAVVLTWVKAHVGIKGNEGADQVAKIGTLQRPSHPVITEGGLSQWWKAERKKEGEVGGTGKGRVVRWESKAMRSYTQCRTGKGNLGVWKNKLNSEVDLTCRKCGKYPETGAHIALSCIEAEGLGRRWSNWKQIDERKRWFRKEKEGDREVVVDLAESFFGSLSI